MRYALPIAGMVLIFALYHQSDLLRRTRIVDADSGLPVANAVITYRYYNTGDYCGQPVSRTSSGNGVVFSPLRFGICAIDAVSPGYHYNGYNHTNHVPKEIKLYARHSQEVPVLLSQQLFEQERMNILDAVLRSPEEGFQQVLQTPPFDFQVEEVVYRPGSNEPNQIAYIRFFGKGGIQQISHDPPTTNNDQRLFDLENLRTAPSHGYVDAMEIVPGKAYVARLRDGHHYIKFYVRLLRKDYSVPYVQFFILANAQASPNLDFANTSPLLFYALP